MSRSSVLIAGAIALAAGGWLASGMLTQEEAAPVPARAEARLPLVEVATLETHPVQRVVTGQGDVRPFRRAAARTQTAGRIEAIHVDRGARVEAGEPILSLSLEGLDSRLREAQVVLDRRRRDYDAASRLNESGYATAERLRELETLLESAREEVRRIEEDIADATIRAPFPGRVDAIAVEPGEYVAAGADVATVIDNVPLSTEIRVAQTDRARLAEGREALVSYATGQVEAGRVCFVSASADPATRTFLVEVRTPNAGGTIPSGISAEVRIPVESVEAQFVSPAALSLGTDGSLGLKSVGEDGRVAFHEVELVRADAGGLWVVGADDGARVITLGQGFVQAGDPVRVSEAGEALPAPASAARRASAAGLPDDLCDRAPALEGRADISALRSTGDAS
jgi:membrane fusion protein, multidrug efflux system